MEDLPDILIDSPMVSSDLFSEFILLTKYKMFTYREFCFELNAGNNLSSSVFSGNFLRGE